MRYLVVLLVASANVLSTSQQQDQGWIPMTNPTVIQKITPGTYQPLRHHLASEQEVLFLNPPPVPLNSNLRGKLIHSSDPLQEQIVGATLTFKKQPKNRKHKIKITDQNSKIIYKDRNHSRKEKRDSMVQLESEAVYQKVAQPQSKENYQSPPSLVQSSGEYSGVPNQEQLPTPQQLTQQQQQQQHLLSTPHHFTPEQQQQLAQHLQEQQQQQQQQQQRGTTLFNGPQVTETEQEQSGTAGYALQIQPQYLVQQPGLINKQPTPIFYGQPIASPTPISYQNGNLVNIGTKQNPYLAVGPVLNAFQPNTHLAAYQPNLHASQNILVPQNGPQFTQGHVLLQPQKFVSAPTPHGLSFIGNGKVENGGGFVGNHKTPTNVRPVHLQPQHRPIANPLGNNFGQPPVRTLGHIPSSELNTDEGPGFDKMFQSYFNSGPFAQEFQLDGGFKKPEATNLKPAVNDGFNNFFGGFAAPQSSGIVNTKKAQGDEGQFQPCNFFKQSNAQVEADDGSNEEASKERPVSDYYRNKYNQQNDDDDDDDDDEDDDDEDGSSEESSNHQRYPQRYEGSKESDEDESQSKRPYKPKNQGYKYQHDSDDHYSGKPSDEKKVVKESNSNRPRYNSGNKSSKHRHHNDDDDDDELKKFKTDPNSEIFDSNYRHAKQPYLDSKKQEKSQSQYRPKEESTNNQNVKTFHHYNPASPYRYVSEDKGNSRNPQFSPEHRQVVRDDHKKPPQPVRERDNVGYYSEISPEVQRDFYYQIQQKVVSSDNLKKRAANGIRNVNV